MFLVRNLAHGRISRTARVLRDGRRTGFILEDGTRVRRKGERGTEIDETTVLRNDQKLIYGLENGYISITDTSSGKEFSAEDIRALSGGPVKKAPVPVVEPEKEPEPEKEEVIGVQETPPEEESEEEPEEEEVSLTEADLKKMKRGELDKLAEEYGLDPSEYRNASQIVDAIIAEAAEEE